MLAHRKLSTFLLGLLIALTTSEAAAQTIEINEMRNKEFDITVGLLGIGSDGDGYLVDLTRRDPEANAPYMIVIADAASIGLKVGRTYSAHTRGGSDISIIVNGVSIRPKKDGMGWGQYAQTWVCDGRPAPEGGHWEWIDGHIACKPGVKEAVKWKADKGSKQETTRSSENKNIPSCDQMGPFHDTILTVVITVKPAAGLKWTFADAPSMVAERILDDLNADHRNITFKEASGVVPNLYINVTANETSEGTRQDTADAYVTGMGKSGILFQASSGQAPFVGLRDAIDHLSTDILKWIEGGWHHAPPCLREDGSVLSQ